MDFPTRRFLDSRCSYPHNGSAQGMSHKSVENLGLFHFYTITYSFCACVAVCLRRGGGYKRKVKVALDLSITNQSSTMKLNILFAFLISIGSLGVITAAPSTDKRQAIPLPIECALVLCARPDCDNGVAFIPPGECCPKCPPNCSAVSCLKPVCKEGEVLETPRGECCPVCTRPGCAAVLCLAITEEDCDEGEIVVVPPGECCAVCQRNCSAVSCLKPVCEEGQTLEVPKGECCPECVDSEFLCLYTRFIMDY